MIEIVNIEGLRFNNLKSVSDLEFRAYMKNLSVPGSNEGFLYSSECMDLSDFFHKVRGVTGHSIYSVSQSTGFRDVNGKKVFTGDVYKFGSFTYLVVYKNGSFIILDNTGWRWLTSCKNGKIIGNIFENPELLKIVSPDEDLKWM